jgi:hypothetical protein
MREKKWYAFAFLLAAFLRFLHLGALPLNDAEAARALQALHTSIQGTDAAYILLTKILFFLFAPSNFWARFIPALAGSFIVLTPYAFREKLGERAARILAFALAVDAGFLAASRQAEGAILAISFTLFALACWERKNASFAGIFAAFALLSGTSIWAGAFSIFLAWLLARGLLLPDDEEDEERAAPSLLRPPEEGEFRKAALAGGAALFLGGTLFFLSPDGLNAAAGAFPTYLFGWVSPSGVPPLLPLAALGVYESFALFFGILGMIRGWEEKDPLSQGMSLWAGAAFFLAILYPSREAFHLLWVIFPLWVLAAKEISRYFQLPNTERVEILSAAALTFILLIFGWLNLAALSLYPVDSLSNPKHILLLLSSALLVILTLLFIGLGWSRRIAIYGGFWGLFAALTLYTISVAWGAAGLRVPQGTELWTPAPPPDADLLLQTVDNLSEWSQGGDAYAQPVNVVGIDSPALFWLLRNHDLHILDSIPFDEPPALILTPPIDSLGLPAEYRGQDFVWRKTPAWEQTSLAAWFLRRETFAIPDKIYLWARADIFLDSQEQNTP